MATVELKSTKSIRVGAILLAATLPIALLVGIAAWLPAPAAARNTHNVRAAGGNYAILVTPTTGLTTEAGGRVSFTVALTGENAPIEPVTLTLVSSDPGEGLPAPEELVFALGQLTHNFAVVGQPDHEADGPQPYTVTLTSASDDHHYSGLTATVSLTNVEELPTYLPYLSRGFDAVWHRHGVPPADVILFYDVERCGDTLLAGTDKGIYSTPALTTTNEWTLEAETPIEIVYRLAIREEVLGTERRCSDVYAASFGDGVYRGAVNGGGAIAWDKITPGSYDHALGVVLREDVVFISGEFGVRWSDYPGAPGTWQDTDLDGLVLGLSIEPVGTDIYAPVWANGVYLNQPGDNETWDKQGNLPDNLVYEAIGDSAGAPWLAGTDSGLFRYKNDVWEAVANDFQERTYTVASIGDARFFAGQLGEGVLYSNDGGDSWIQLNEGIEGVTEDFRVRGFTVDPELERVYVATSTGVYWRRFVMLP